MSKMIELKAYHLSELAKDNAGNSEEIQKILENVEKFKELSPLSNVDGLVQSLTDAMMLNVLELPVFQARNNVSKEDNVLLVQNLLDLKQPLEKFIMELTSKIENELSEKLDEMISKAKVKDHSSKEIAKTTLPNEMVKPALPIRQKTESSSSLNKVHDDKEGKETPTQKKGAFSKMLTHLTKARPKASRTKRNDNNQEEDSTKDEIQDTVKTDNSVNVGEFKTDENLHKISDQGSPELSYSATKINPTPANVSPKGNKSLEQSPVKPAKQKPPSVKESSEPMKPAPAPRPTKKSGASPEDAKPVISPSENEDASPSKVKSSSQPQKNIPDESTAIGSPLSASSHVQEVNNGSDSGIGPPTESITSSKDITSLADANRPISLVQEPISFEPASDTLSHADVNSRSPPKRIPGLSGQHGAIGALAAAVTGRKTIPVAGVNSMSTSSELEAEANPETVVAPKPTPPKRPVKNIASENGNEQAQNVPPTPVPRPAAVDRIITDRPKSEVPTSSSNSPIDVQRPLSLVDEIGYKEETILEQAQSEGPPKRIPGVFASQHGAIGALAAAVTGRRHNSLNSHADSESSQPASRHNSIPQHVSSPLNSSAAQVGQEGIQDSAPPPPNDELEQISSNNPLNASVTTAPLIFKKKDASLSGDDKGIEKSALDWLNQHLSSKNIQITDLYSSLGDGLNLIYALEDATKESVGKYNKRTMLPVHKIDNLSVGLNFLAKKGVDVQFVTPQDIMDGNKGKILTLFVGILKL